MGAFSGWLDRYFHFSAKGSSVKTEALAGLATFMSMAYLIFVVPDMLADAGMPKEATVTATILVTAGVTLVMGLWANFPVGVAPGLGISAFFAYYVCGTMGLPWQTALGAVFISGVVFLILTVTRLRQMIIDAVPMDLKYATVAGIGSFIAFIGLKKCGVIVASKANFVALGDVASPEAALALAGVCAIAAMMARGMKTAIPLGIVGVAVLGMALGHSPLPRGLDDVVSFSLPSPGPVFLKPDIMGAVHYGLISIIFSITMVDLFDNIGTLIGLSRKAGLMDKDGHIPNLDKALITDSVGTMGSAFAGVPTVTAYVESAAGVAVGGRTGLTAVFVALFFLVTLIFAPLVTLVPGYATAPALVVVGALMMQDVTHIDFGDITTAVPAFLTILMMPLTFSIASGFGMGFISYAVLKSLAGKAREVGPVMWVIALCFAANFALRLH